MNWLLNHHIHVKLWPNTPDSKNTTKFGIQVIFNTLLEMQSSTSWMVNHVLEKNCFYLVLKLQAFFWKSKTFFYFKYKSYEWNPFHACPSSLWKNRSSIHWKYYISFRSNYYRWFRSSRESRHPRGSSTGVKTLQIIYTMHHNSSMSYLVNNCKTIF